MVEYKVVKLNVCSWECEEMLNRLAVEGWEIIDICKLGLDKNGYNTEPDSRQVFIYHLKRMRIAL